MNILEAIILGIVEGVTEFLPISSTGHLILASDLLGIAQSDFVKSFEIIIQLGAILAVVVLYARKIFQERRLITPIIAGFLPTAIVGLALYKVVKSYLLGNTLVVVGSLFVGGVVMIIIERWIPKHFISAKVTTSVSTRHAVLIGLFQSLAIIPGVSRSAATIIGGLLIGIERQTIVEFSFLLAIPTMAAATGLDLIKSASLFSSSQILVLSIGFIVSFVTALGSIRFLLQYIQKHDFTAFGVYRIVIAGLFLLAMLY